MLWCGLRNCVDTIRIQLSTYLTSRSARTGWIEERRRWSGWLRHCATIQKVKVSIPDGVIGILFWLNPSGRTMAPCSTQPLAEISIVNFVKPRAKFSHKCYTILSIMWPMNIVHSWDKPGLSELCTLELLKLINVVHSWTKWGHTLHSWAK